MCGNAKCWLTTFAILNFILLLFAALIYVITNPLIDVIMQHEFVVDSEESPRFTYWACKYSLSNFGVCEPPHDSVPFNEGYYIFNLTNLDEVYAGGTPKFMQFGPYFYNVDIFKYDIAFLNNSQLVEYNEAKTYYFDPELSCEGCTPEDEYIGINPGYVGAVELAGSETLLLLGMGGPVIGKILRDLNDTFIQYLIERNGLEYWLEECSGWDPDCASPFDMAMIQWGWFSRVLPNQMGLGEGTA